MIIKDFLRQMCVPLENSAYFGDGDGFNSNPDQRSPPTTYVNSDYNAVVRCLV